MPIPHPTDLLHFSPPLDYLDLPDHIHILTTYLDDLQHFLANPNTTPPPDLFTTFLTPEQHQDLLLNLHLLLLGLYLLQDRRDFQRHTLTLTQDLAHTLKHTNPIGSTAATMLNLLAQILRSGQSVGTPLHAAELHHAGAFLLDHAEHLGLPLPPHLAPDSTFWTVYHRPDVLQDPTRPALSNLHPDPTIQPAWQAREHELLSLLRQDPRQEEHVAILLLLHLNARDRYTNQPVVPTMNYIALCLIAAQDLHTQDRTPAHTTRRLRQHLQDIHQELGRPRVDSLRPGTLLRTPDRDITFLRALGALRTMHFLQLADPCGTEHQNQQYFWQIFDQSDAQLTQGLDPQQDHDLRLRLMLSSCTQLARTFRAPGMALPPLVDIAAQLADIDPLWGWKELQSPANYDDPQGLAQAFDQFVAALNLRSSMHVFAPNAPEHQILTFLIREYAGHLRARLRSLNLRLPLHQQFEDSLRPYGAIRASLQTPQEEQHTFKLWRQLLTAVTQRLETYTPPTTPLIAPSPVEAEVAPQVHPAAVQTEALGTPQQLPTHIENARVLLKGRTVTLIGGLPDPAHHQALVEAFDLADLEWIGAAEYDHGIHAYSRVTEHTAVVILAIRWMSHAHNGLRDVARAKGVAYVMHPGGLNPSSVA